jgi:hypothetical protein
VEVEELLVDAQEVGQVHPPVRGREHEDGPPPGAPRAGDHPEPAQVELVTGQPLEVVLQVGQLQPPVGDPVVETLHQLGLAHRRQGVEVDPARVDPAVQVAIQRRVGHRVTDQLAEALVLQAPELLAAPRPRGGQLAPAGSEGSPEVGQALDAHPARHRWLPGGMVTTVMFTVRNVTGDIR